MSDICSLTNLYVRLREDDGDNSFLNKESSSVKQDWKDCLEILGGVFAPSDAYRNKEFGKVEDKVEEFLV